MINHETHEPHETKGFRKIMAYGSTRRLVIEFNRRVFDPACSFRVFRVFRGSPARPSKISIRSLSLEVLAARAENLRPQTILTGERTVRREITLRLPLRDSAPS